jgi:hypothetical protein
MKYKQLKDLPFSKKGDIWEVEKEKIIINGVNYTICSPCLWKDLVIYYTDDDIIDMNDGIWFEIFGTEDEKKLEIQKIKKGIVAEIDFYQCRIEDLNLTLKKL